MNRTAAVYEKVALHLAWHSQAKLPARAINITPLKIGGRHPEKFRNAFQIGFRQKDEALLSAAIRAAGLALESKASHTEAALALVRNCLIRSIAAIKFS